MVKDLCYALTMTITAQQLAALTLEVWRAAGHRTEERRDILLNAYAVSYFGIPQSWGRDTHELVEAAKLLLRQRTRIDELRY